MFLFLSMKAVSPARSVFAAALIATLPLAGQAQQSDVAHESSAPRSSFLASPIHVNDYAQIPPLGEIMAVSPDWDSDRIRAVRTVFAIDAVVFRYRTETRIGTGVPSITSGTVSLASDFVDVAVGDVHHLDDFFLCRSLSWGTYGKTVLNQSYYAMPAFRLLEAANRKVLREAVQKMTDQATLPVDLNHPYWAEQELAVQLTKSSPLVASDGITGVEWRLGDTIVAQTSSAGLAFSADERPGLTRYLARRVDLHPQFVPRS